jgi:hypothetical protein
MARDKAPPNLDPLFHVMGEFGFNTFLLVGLDNQGRPAVMCRSTSPASHRALRGYVDDWADMEMEAHGGTEPQGR